MVIRYIMKLKLVKVPKNEEYTFGRLIFKRLLGDDDLVFGNIMNKQGWMGYPYNSDEGPNLILVANEENIEEILNKLRIALQNGYRMYIVITSATNLNIELNESWVFNEIIDLSSYKEYYETELNFDKFADSLLETTEETASQKD